MAEPYWKGESHVNTGMYIRLNDVVPRRSGLGQKTSSTLTNLRLLDHLIKNQAESAPTDIVSGDFQGRAWQRN